MYRKDIESNKEANQLYNKAQKANAAERLAKLKKNKTKKKKEEV
jgi:hypothetical protein